MDRDGSPWYPIDELASATSSASVVGLILIQNNGIMYPGERTDPIFLAEKTLNETFGWYSTTRWHAGVLACKDTLVVCSPDSKAPNCQSLWEFGQFKATHDEITRVRLLLQISLNNANIFDSLVFRAALALDAQSKLVGIRSLSLPIEQWKVEVQQLFETSLARIQIDARNMARGASGSANLPGRRQLLDLRSLGVCNQYKFRSTGWKNINVFGFLAAVFAAIAMMLLSVPRGEEGELWVEEPLSAFARARVVISLKHYIVIGYKACKSGLSDFIKITAVWMKEAWKGTWKFVQIAWSFLFQGAPPQSAT